ncbi:NTP transferase domain-containing protein [Solilutibacter silvestris]|uniref:Molybdopterin-guanine dinucleotide biosynthesis protein A n=1 Tax=Solilutibacter silvestris TaxID=1645665 RepID=A0A2K1Q359_9GAMM|nr:NTP transferase domain-containing protein [Lysobacter silvestris]PNS09482.1 Molybdopterin-guanine dinucleotide biosynthesis protein A [Lysobacter silvestris]
MTAPLYGLLLSGGESRRMQQDKAALDYLGEPQLLRAWRLLEDVTERAFVSVRDAQTADPLRAGLPQIVDRYPAVGPIAGILSAQAEYPDVAWLVLACDLPLLDETTLHELIARRDPQLDATVYASSHDGLPEPLCAIWEPSSAVTLLQRYRDGSHCPRKALAILRTLVLPSPGEALDNANTPAEREDIRRRLGATT